MMIPAKEKRRYQRQEVLLPLRVTEQDAKGKLLFQGNTVNVGAGGVYFQTLNWHEMRLGMRVHVIIDISPETFQLLPFGGLRGTGKVIRIETPPAKKRRGADAETENAGVAVHMTTRLKFDPDLHLPRFEPEDESLQ